MPENSNCIEILLVFLRPSRQVLGYHLYCTASAPNQILSSAAFISLSVFRCCVIQTLKAAK
jgi:hypothetical protein